MSRLSGLTVVAGKGGVGRTTVAAALAARAIDEGKRVLAVDAVGVGELDALIDRADAGDRLETLRLTPGAALDEYLRIFLRLPIAPSRLGPLSRVFDYVSTAAPGVREILTIGKIGWEVRNGPWDEVIVDGPATGHAVELLAAPTTMAELIPTGPLAEQTGWLSEVLAAPTSGVVVVTIPEELPATETGELLDRLRAETATPVRGIVVNRMPQSLDEPGRAEAEHLAERLRETRTGTDPRPGRSGLAAAASLVLARETVASEQLTRIEAYGLPITVVEEQVADPVAAVLDRLAGANW